MFQEQTGLYGAIVIQPRSGYAQAFDRDYVVLLSDWSFEQPETIVSNLKFQSDYYNYGQRTLGTFVEDAQRRGLAETVADRLEWGSMRMSPTDILDVSGATYTYLLNGQPPGANWTALFRPGERVRLRFINGSSMSIFDVRIDGLPMTVVQADGNDIVPVTVDAFRISAAETYDVIVQPGPDRAYTIFAQSEDRTGYARGTLAPRAGMDAPIPSMDPRPMRTMTDMGMGGMEHGSMSGMNMDPGSMPGTEHSSRPGMSHGSMPGMQMDHGRMAAMKASPEAKQLQGSVGVDNVAMLPTERLNRAGEGFPPGRRVLTYADLRALKPRQRSATALARDHAASHRQHGALHLGLRRQEIFGVRADRAQARRPRAFRPDQRHDDGAPDPSARPLERTRERARRIPPLQAHNQVKPGEKLSYLVTADAPGRWAYHCHLLYHMETGMFREVHVA